MSDVDVLVIGGGPAGLGAAYRLSRAGDVEWLLCEADDVLGGLSRSFVDDAGFTWDLGGHVFFSHYDLVTEVLRAALGPDGWFEHRREAWVRLGTSWVPYPFQNNLHRLPAEERDRCIRGLVEAAEARPAGGEPRDFGEFVRATFGEGVAELFMVPYNEKVWAHPLDMLSYAWIGERVSVPDAATVLSNAATCTDDVDWGPNSTFMFPRAGGTGAFWSGVGRLLPPGRVRTGCRVVAVDAKARVAELSDGASVRYRHLVTTAPLDVTARLLGDDELIGLTAGLTHSSVHVLGLGVDGGVGECLGTRCWVYFADPAVPFYRVTNFSHYSPAHVPAGSGLSSLLVEVSESPYRPVDAGRLAESVAEGLTAQGILEDPGQVAHVWRRRVEHAYPTPTLGRDAIVDRAHRRLEDLGILSRGRFGTWRYEVGNMDHSFAQGYEAAARLITGEPETTHRDAARVNAPDPELGWGRLR